MHRERNFGGIRRLTCKGCLECSALGRDAFVAPTANDMYGRKHVEHVGMQNPAHMQRESRLALSDEQEEQEEQEIEAGAVTVGPCVAMEIQWTLAFSTLALLGIIHSRPLLCGVFTLRCDGSVQCASCELGLSWPRARSCTSSWRPMQCNLN